MTKIEPTKKDLVFQTNTIGQAIHTLPLNLRRLVAVAMARIKQDSDMDVCFNIEDAIDALDLSHDFNIKQAVVNSLENAGRQIVKIDTRAVDGKFTIYPWFSMIQYDDVEQAVRMVFNPNLKPYIQDFTSKFSMFKLSDYGQLSGEYAQKIFDLVMSYKGFEGRGGNYSGEWFFDKTPDEMRVLLGIRAEQYSKTAELRRRCIDNPVKQINEAGIGLRIEMEYKKRGKVLKAFRFNCRMVKRGEPRTASPATQTEDEDEKLILLNAELYEAIKDDIRKQPELIEETRFGSVDSQIELQALKELKKRLHK
jgi:plasmid replication initiation protein